MLAEVLTYLQKWRSSFGMTSVSGHQAAWHGHAPIPTQTPARTSKAVGKEGHPSAPCRNHLDLHRHSGTPAGEPWGSLRSTKRGGWLLGSLVVNPQLLIYVFCNSTTQQAFAAHHSSIPLLCKGSFNLSHDPVHMIMPLIWSLEPSRGRVATARSGG